jgi:hypothetical protein
MRYQDENIEEEGTESAEFRTQSAECKAFTAHRVGRRSNHCVTGKNSGVTEVRS